MNTQRIDIEKIGGLSPLKKSEEKLISDYLKKRARSKKKMKSKKNEKGINQEIE